MLIFVWTHQRCDGQWPTKLMVIRVSNLLHDSECFGTKESQHPPLQLASFCGIFYSKRTFRKTRGKLREGLVFIEERRSFVARGVVLIEILFPGSCSADLTLFCNNLGLDRSTPGSFTASQRVEFLS